MKASLFFSVPTVAVVCACSAIVGIEDVPPAAPSGPVTSASSAAADIATAFCNKFKECQPANFDYQFGSFPECTTAITEGQVRLATLPGSLATVDSLKKCATDVGALTCPQFAGSNLGLVCAAVGSRQDGETCLENTQCASGFCAGDDGSGFCRLCAQPPASGRPCVKGGDGTGQCAAGDVCNADNQCVAVTGEGITCSSVKPCAPGLFCNDSQQCTKLPSVVGEECSTLAGRGCNTASGLVCINLDELTPTKGTCFAAVVSDFGGRCGGLPDRNERTYLICRRGAPCGADQRCGIIPTGEGDPCPPKSQCLYPFTCVEGQCRPLGDFSVCE